MKPKIKVNEIMNCNPKVIHRDETVAAAARNLASNDIGFLPVAEGDRLIGVVTDRDLVVRVMATGKDPSQVCVGEILTDKPKYCFDDEDIGHVQRNMDELHVRRLPVVNRDKRLVGIVSRHDIRQSRTARAK